MHKYHRPQLFVIGAVETSTFDGSDPCRFMPPGGVDKQTGDRDYVIANAALAYCDPISNTSV